MAGTKLVTHFVNNVVNVVWVADRRRCSGDTSRFGAGDTDHSQTSDTASSGAKHVAEVVVGAADNGINIRLILAQHRRPRRVGVGIRIAVEIDELIGIGYQYETNRQFPFINS